jgi:hypothetical protein
MNWEKSGGIVSGAWCGIFGGTGFVRARGGTRRRRATWNWVGFLCLLAWGCLSFRLCAQDTPAAAATNAMAGTPAEQKAALELERTNAWQQVNRIVNQPVRAYRRTEGLQVEMYSPGWFHDGAIKPDFNTVDVRQSQELLYANLGYVTSDLNPGIVFQGQDLEFNSMTKYFYLNRSLPKHKLSQAAMVEINRLYRIIGHCESQMRRLDARADAAAMAVENSNRAAADTETVAAPAAAPEPPLAGIRSIPREKRILYGGLAIGALIGLALLLRLLKSRSN